MLTESFDRAQPALGLVVPLKQRTRGTPWFCSLTNDYTDLNAAERTGTQTVPETQTEVAQSPSSAPTHTRTRGQGVLTESSDQAQPASGLTAPLTQCTRGTPWFCSLTDANVDPNAASYSTAPDLCARATRPFEMGMILVIGRKSAVSVPVQKECKFSPLNPFDHKCEMFAGAADAAWISNLDHSVLLDVKAVILDLSSANHLRDFLHEGVGRLFAGMAHMASNMPAHMTTHMSRHTSTYPHTCLHICPHTYLCT